jgi:hypothetical protein
MVVGNEAMSAHRVRIWVVITDGANTRICSCQDGMTTPISTPIFELPGSALAELDVRAYKAWFKTEGRGCFSQNPRHHHLLHVSQLLLEAARERAYDRLIIIAAGPVAAERENALAPETRARLIGEIVRDHTIPAPVEASPLPELRH